MMNKNYKVNRELYNQAGKIIKKTESMEQKQKKMKIQIIAKR